MPDVPEKLKIAQPQPIPPRTPNFSWKVFLLAISIILLLSLGGYYYYRAYKEVNLSESEILSIVRQKILPSVVQVGCSDVEGGPETQIGSGLYYTDDTGAPMVETAAHVVIGKDGEFHGCNVYFPRPDGSFYDSVYSVQKVWAYDKSESVVGGEKIHGLDYAQLLLSSSTLLGIEQTYPFPPDKPNPYDTFKELCPQKTIEIGEKVYLLGYPKTGGKSITLTDGVVSGFSGDFTKISASANAGNSGGIVVSTRGCNYGIPVKATFESGGNLAFSISAGFIREFLDNLTGEAIYSPPPSNATNTSQYLTQSYSFPGFDIKYPDQWTLFTSTIQSDQSYSVSFISPQEGVLDNLREIVTVVVVPNVPENYLGPYIKKNITDIVIPPNYVPIQKGRYLISRGMKTYSILYGDDSLRLFSVPTLDSELVFWYKGVLYDLILVAEIKPDSDAFLNLFSAMGDSLRFK